MPDVSVVIAAYNIELYIERAVRSALDQQEVSVEVIVVNDGSTDRTKEIAAGLGDPRVRVISLPRNAGPAAARNAGMAAATAPWIAVLDGDDTYSPKRLFRCLLRAKAVKADIVVDNIEVHSEETGKTYPMYEPKRFARLGVIDLAKFVKGNVFFMRDASLGFLQPVFSTAFLKVNNLSYDTEIRIGEDYMLMAEALAKGAMCVVEPSIGYHYTVRKGSVSHRLTLDDVARIEAADTKFKSRYHLDPATAKAQAERDGSVKEAYAFVRLVDAIKQRNLLTALGVFLSCPPAAWHVAKTKIKQRDSRC